MNLFSGLFPQVYFNCHLGGKWMAGASKNNLYFYLHLSYSWAKYLNNPTTIKEMTLVIKNLLQIEVQAWMVLLKNATKRLKS